MIKKEKSINEQANAKTEVHGSNFDKIDSYFITGTIREKINT